MFPDNVLDTRCSLSKFHPFPILPWINSPNTLTAPPAAAFSTPVPALPPAAVPSLSWPGAESSKISWGKPPPSGAMNLFTYGTLMDPAIWARVAQTECVSRPAVLHGYDVRRLRGVTFPGLVESENCSASGLLCLNVSAAAMQRLDDYEDDFYERIEVTVQLDDGTGMAAQVYLMHPAHRDLVLPERWLPPAG